MIRQLFQFFKFSNIAWLVLIAAGTYGLYSVKYRVLALQREIAGLTRELKQEEENLHVISAEWAYLTRPDRLQALAKKNTRLMPVQGVQVVQLNALPFPQARDDNMAQTLPPAGLIPASVTGTNPRLADEGDD